MAPDHPKCVTTGRPPVRLPCLNDQQSDNTELVAEGWGASSAIAVSFEDDRNAYNALTSLKELDSHKRVGVREAVVVVRGEDGHVVEMDRVESMSPPPHGGRRTHRLLIGIIGGPLGMLIGGATGLMVGSPCDLEDIDETESALGVISSTVQVGRTALLAVVSEQSPDVVDPRPCRTSAAPCCADPSPPSGPRSPRPEDAERKPSGKPARSLPHWEHDKAAVDAKLDQLKAKLSRGQKAPA